MAELEYGIAKSSSPEQNTEALQGFLAPLEILSFDDAAACRYGEIRAYLGKKGEVIGGMDMLIAAHAGSHGCTLVSNNLREFEIFVLGVKVSITRLFATILLLFFTSYV